MNTLPVFVSILIMHSYIPFGRSLHNRNLNIHLSLFSLILTIVETLIVKVLNKSLSNNTEVSSKLVYIDIILIMIYITKVNSVLDNLLLKLLVQVKITSEIVY